MAIIDIKCKHCGMNVETDEDHNHGVCPYCGTEYIIENVEQINNENEIGYEYMSLTINNNEFNNINTILESFKYEYVSQLICSENEIRVKFKRPKTFSNKEKINSLEQEYYRLDEDIYQLSLARCGIELKNRGGIVLLLVFGLFFLILGVVCAILGGLVYLIYAILGSIFCTMAIIFISKNRQSKAKIREFYEKIETQKNDIQKRMGEIIEEVSKL